MPQQHRKTRKRVNYIEETYNNEDESEPEENRQITNQPDTTEQKRPLRNQIENKREIPELHNRYRITRNLNAKQPNNVRTERYPTAARKISRREQKRDQILGQNLGQHRIQR